MSAPAIKAIPTDYAGVHFRSRLEARWAAFFDRAGWRWSYEPQDFHGYLPDFALWFRVPVLVEVKPLQWDESDNDESILDGARSKIARSGIKGEVIVLGSRVVTHDDRHPLPLHRLGRLMAVDATTDEVSPWAWAFAFKCDHCGLRTFANEDESWHCRRTGCYDEFNPRSTFGEWNADEDFRRASSEVQWRPR